MKKEIQMEYPDGSIHNIEVSDFNHNIDKNIDYIDYYDLNENKSMYAILKNIDGEYYKDSNVYDYTYDELSKNINKIDINLLPNKIKNIKNTSKYELEFEVYDTDTGSYIASSIAEAFHLNKKYRNKKINNVICIPVTEEEIKRIELISNQGIPCLKAKRVNQNILEQAQIEFNVYHLTEVNKYFVNDDICKLYDVGTGTHYINSELCREVTYEDVRKIEEQSKDKNPCLKAVFKDLTFSKKTVEAYTNNKNTYYINDDICENKNIGRGHHYINDILYKEVTKEEIEKLKEMNINVEFKELKFKKLIQEFIVYVDVNADRYFINEKDSNILKIGKGTHYIGDKLCREITQNEIKDVQNNSLYNDSLYEPKYIYLQFSKETTIEKKEEIEKTDVYKDKNNHNKLFVKVEDCRKYKIGDKNSFKYINNNECYEISLIELTKIIKPVVKTVYYKMKLHLK